ncbi:MAG: hypothetical protein II453_00335 [Alphaproteobacteria bacterium]|nr:hypothetical protein [Alphaproteobacteria bacterium]
MSVYIDFFIRRGDDFIPLSDYSRNSIIYKIANSYAMWEKVSPLSKAGIEQMITEAERQQRAYQESIVEVKAKMAQLKDLSCTWNEALEYLDDYEEAIQEYEQDIKEARYAKHFFGFLIDIIETVEYADKKEYDYNNYIYVGIEIGHPTVKDIV